MGSASGERTALLDLDDPRCVDRSRAGAKAAWLARARAAGLPVLPGVVVPADASRAHLSLGVDALARRGSGGARLEVSAEPMTPSLAQAVVDAARTLDRRVVVRSSSVVEDDAVWAGAFTSYLDLEPDEVPRAVVGCWASAFGVSTLERFAASGTTPDAAPMAALVQPFLRPDAGGVARLDGEDVVVVATEGSPAPLVQGWDLGVQARVSPAGKVEGQMAISLVGHEVLRSVAEVVRAAHDLVGATMCEWAVTEGQVHLLQLSSPAPLPRSRDRPRVELLASPEAVRLARLAARFPGPLGEAYVLPWAGGGDVEPVGGGDVTGADLAAVHARVAALTSQVWGLPAADALAAAQATLRQARGPSPQEALARLARLPVPDPTAAAEILSALRTIRLRLVEIDAVTWPETAWLMEPDEVGRLLTGPAVRKRDRFGFDRWEPFLAAVVMGTGLRGAATAAAPGTAAGRMCRIADGDTGGFRPRDVVVAPFPIPDLAPLLWDAAAIVTVGGGPGAHLFESARALAIPAVCGIEGEAADELFGDDDRLIAVDGDEGTVYSMER